MLKNNFNFIYVLFLLSASLQVNKPFLKAEPPLTEMIENGGYDWVKESKGIKPVIKRPEWLDSDSNFWKIFIEARSPQILADWAGDPGYNYVLKKRVSGFTKDHAFLKSVYKLYRDRSKHFFIAILVPLPTLADVGDISLISSFRQYFPPALEYTHKEDFVIQGFKGTFFKHKKPFCSVTIPISRTGLIYAETKYCQESNELINLCDEINIKRLNQKLES